MDRVLWWYIYRASVRMYIGLFCGDIMEPRHLESVSYQLQKRLLYLPRTLYDDYVKHMK